MDYWISKSFRLGQIAYRPITLTDCMGKLLEHMIAAKINAELTEENALSTNQFGFRAGKSTTDAVRKAMEIASVAKNESSRRHKKWCAMITRDVKNAFNTVLWSEIIKALEKKNISRYLQKFICSYFHKRKICINASDIEMTAGVPQGSVLGPLLWIIFYDKLLEQKNFGVTLIEFADDLAILTVADSQLQLEYIANRALNRVTDWMEKKNLELALHRTESVILCGPRKKNTVSFNIKGVEIKPAKQLKYLGIIIYQNRTFGAHITYPAKKAKKTIFFLGRLMPKIGGPANRVRTILLNGVANCILLYEAPVWHEVRK